MRRLIIIINLSLIVAFMMMFADCSDSSKARKQVSIGYVNWSEGIAMSYLAKVMLESKGYDVMLRNADIAPVFVSMAAGKVDVFMDAWLPATHADYIRKYGDMKQEVCLEFFYLSDKVGISITNGIALSDSHINGTGIGLKNVSHMMYQMNGCVEIPEMEKVFRVILWFPVIKDFDLM